MKGGAKAIYWILLNVLGWSLTVAGVILMPLPGPGLLILFTGIIVLSQCYRWARSLRYKISGAVEKSTKASVETKFRIFMSITSAGLIIAFGVLLYLDLTLPSELWFTLGPVEVGPKIPYRTAGGAIALMASGVIALSLLLYAGIKYKVLRPGPEEKDD